MINKAIILCGGSGSRLSPITKITNKQLINVYDKPMFYYPLSLLMLCGIKNFLFIVSNNQSKYFEQVLGNKEDLGINIEYSVQMKPSGLPEAFIIGEKFIGNDSIAMILGDNFFFGSQIVKIIKKSFTKSSEASIYTYPSKNPSAYGVVEFNKKNQIYKIIEKPKNTKSNTIITGLYKFDNNVVEYAKKLRPSNRKELEIVDLIREYLKKKKLSSISLGRGSAWMDLGNFDDLQNASNFVKNIEDRQGLKIGCLEEIAYQNKWIEKKNILNRIKFFSNTRYSKYLENLIR
jgi:glucose-1-phosphate thymidylyltransferase